MEYPEYFARFYDFIYDRIRSGTDHAFFMDKMKETQGPVLEVGTGTGRFFTEALESGVDIYGIDISRSMLDVLKTKIATEQHHRISQQDVTSFELDKKFSLVIAPFRVFSHILKPDDQLCALNNIYKHLVPGGRFIFDLFVPDLRLLLEGLENQMDFEGEYEPGKRLRRYVSVKADIVNQISVVTMKFNWDEDSGKNEQVWTIPFRFYFRYEIEHLIERSMLTLGTIYGDYKENTLEKESKEFIIVCKRK